MFAEKFLPSNGVGPLSTTAVLCVLGLLWFVATREATTLRKIPGPFLASVTKLWIFQKQKSYKRPLVDMALHKKYGPIVRIAPNEVLISSPQAFRTVYGAGSNFRKGDWYIGTGTCGWSGPDNLDFLNELNMEKYRIQRRAVGPAYTEAEVKNYEPQIDATIEKNIGIMRERAGQRVDLDMFFNMFSSDCYAEATFSKSMNLVERDHIDDSITALHDAWHYMHIVGYFPNFHRAMTAFTHLIGKNTDSIIHVITILLPFLQRARGGQNVKKAHPFAFPITQIDTRLKSRVPSQAPQISTSSDITSKLISLQSEKGVLTDPWIRNMVMTNFGAGVETTAIVISTLIDNIVSHPGCQEKVHAELDKVRREKEQEGEGKWMWKTRDMSETLPYLYACLRESMRVHAVVGMPLARVVPEGGVELEGKWIPGGTTVGINPWVLSRDKTLYGDDSNEWRPERWLEYSPQKLKYLETYSITFGTGARSCPGKYLAQSVFMKMIPALFQDFEWEFTEPGMEKNLQCTFSVRYVGLGMRWRVREGH